MKKTAQSPKLVNAVLTGDCLDLMKDIPAGAIDFVLTDPPYMASYRPRSGETVINDSDSGWFPPAVAELYRVLKNDSFCFMFYGWPVADVVVSAARAVGFRPVSHFSFVKKYCSYSGYSKAQHEVAYLFAKGRPQKPGEPPSDVQPWSYTGNKLHPTEKPVSVLTPLVKSFSQPGEIILDPFCGSGSSLVAASLLQRQFIGMEIDPKHAATAQARLTAPRAA